MKDEMISLKSYVTCAIVVMLAGCQTPGASNQGTAGGEARAATGQSTSPSSRYEAESLGPLLPPSVFDRRGGFISKPP
jgi:hypothetical protein